MIIWDKKCSVEDLVGTTITNLSGAKEGSYQIDISISDGRKFIMTHHQNCCENVTINQIDGDISDLIDSPLLIAEEVSSEGAEEPEHSESFTWTFYRFATQKGYVTFRWLGTSNGWYSERVDFNEVKEGQEEF